MTKKKLAVIEINECDFRFFKYGARKYNYPKIENFLKNKKSIKTFTRDTKEGLNLDPWVQWVTVHTGKLSKNHKIFRLGQVLNKKINQIWDLKKFKNLKIGLWGLFNSINRKKKNIIFYCPDPWSYTQKAYPNALNQLVYLPRYYAQNYPNISKLKLVLFGILFFKKIIFSSVIFYLLKNIIPLGKIFLFSGLKSFNLYFFLDLISLQFVRNQVKINNIDLLIFATNAFAHYQHNYWDSNKYEKYYFWYLNEFVKVFNYFELSYKSVLIYNGFDQKKVKKKYILRLKDLQNFFKSLNLKFHYYEQNMTTGVTVFFKSKKDKNFAIKAISSLKINNDNLFEVINYQKNKIYFQFNLIFFTDDILGKISKKDYLVIKKIKNIQVQDNAQLIRKILNNSLFIKSTSSHVNNGMLYYKSIKNSILKNQKIENYKVFKIIENHFN